MVQFEFETDFNGDTIKIPDKIFSRPLNDDEKRVSDIPISKRREIMLTMLAGKN